MAPLAPQRRLHGALLCLAVLAAPPASNAALLQRRARDAAPEYTLLHFLGGLCSGAPAQCQTLVPVGCGLGSCCRAGEHYVKVKDNGGDNFTITGGDADCQCYYNGATNHGTYVVDKCQDGIQLTRQRPASCPANSGDVLSARHCNGISQGL